MEEILTHLTTIIIGIAFALVPMILLVLWVLWIIRNLDK